MIPVKINYFSDIHLEFGPLELPQTDADIIIAAGDIGIYKQGVEWLQSLGKPVIYVAGNHEFYDQEYFSTISALRDSAAGSQVNFLEKDSVVFEEVRYLGCTLWTNLGEEEHERQAELLNSLNDFRKISYHEDLIEAGDYIRLNIESRQWLVNELAKPFSGKTVIVTHHAPTEWSWNKPKTLLQFAYCNDLKNLMHQYRIAAWFHGHTHSVSDYICAGTKILCNPRGYSGIRMVEEFNPGKIVEV